jgi:hypothetical protein
MLARLNVSARSVAGLRAVSYGEAPGGRCGSAGETPMVPDTEVLGGSNASRARTQVLRGAEKRQVRMLKPMTVF